MGQSAQAVARAPERPRPLLIAALGAAVLLIAGSLYHSRRQAQPAAPPALPDLAPLLQAPECRAGSGSSLAHHAQGLERMALARQQRSVFVAAEGPRAALLMSEASRCFQEAGLAEDATRTQSSWTRMQEELTTRFQGHRLRLQLALRNKQTAAAQDEIHELNTLLAGLDVPADSPIAKLQAQLAFEQRRLAASVEKKTKR